MRDIIAIHDGEIFVAFFGFGEFSLDCFGERSEDAGVFGFDIDLLDLEGSALRAGSSVSA